MKFYPLLFVLISIFSIPGFAASTSEQEFTRQYTERAKLALKQATFNHVDNLVIEIEFKNGLKVTSYLANSYARYISGQASMDEALTDFIASQVEYQNLDESDVLNISQLRPVIKSQSYLDGVKSQLAAAGVNEIQLPYYEKLTGELLVFYAIDSPDSLRFLTQQDFQSLAISSRNLRSKAIANLDKYLNTINAKIEKLDIGDHGDVYMLVADENYEATAILTPSFKKLLKQKIPGEVVIGIPSRNILLIASKSDNKAVMSVAGITYSQFPELAYAISPNIYTLKDDSWQQIDL
ncbi:DUF1444 family protein [Pseudoalteromonas sp. SR41-8]|uniref:DUF1444 family protein n=1 Tax=Pseudoalteromonas sp. SR41-8 TaxID=2760946 RepID=UPI001603B0DB|nr:DUF1444 family protein [Pseudoalteromonas sp. SR41-8]MBB1311893.1 DUF1444 family protein [Pseudoalteromonas sp. SR41-8]